MTKILLVESNAKAYEDISNAFQTIQSIFHPLGIESDYFILDQDHPERCRGCGKCIKQRTCIFDDAVNQTVQTLEEYDGIILGFDLQYGYPNNAMLSYTERLTHCGGSRLAYMPISYFIHPSTTTYHDEAFDALFTQVDMTVLTRNHHYQSTNDEDIEKLAQVMAWMSQCIALGKENDICKPENQERRMEFMR